MGGNCYQYVLSHSIDQVDNFHGRAPDYGTGVVVGRGFRSKYAFENFFCYCLYSSAAKGNFPFKRILIGQ
jgi:hypothetical protein